MGKPAAQNNEKIVRSTRVRDGRVASRKTSVRNVNSTSSTKTKKKSPVNQEKENIEATHALVCFVKLTKSGEFKDQKYSVVYLKSIVEKDIQIKSIVHVLYGKTQYQARVERLSGDKSFLLKLRLDTEGKIALSQAALAKTKRHSLARAKTGPTKEEKQKQALAVKLSNAVSSKVNAIISKTPHVLTSKPVNAQFTSAGVSLVSTDTSSDLDPLLDRQSSSILSNPEVPSPPSSEALGCVTQECSSFYVTMLVTPEEEALLQAMRKTEIPKVTPDCVSTLGGLLKFAKLISEMQQHSTSRKPTYEVPCTPLNKQIQKVTTLDTNGCGDITDTRVELMPGSHLYISAVDKQMLTCNYKHQPMELARRLLKLLVTPLLLAQMSVGGSREYPAIPECVQKPVKEYIVSLIDKSESDNFLKNYPTKINSMCGFLRFEHGLAKKIESDTKKDGQARKKPGRKSLKTTKLDFSSESGDEVRAKEKHESVYLESAVSSNFLEEYTPSLQVTDEAKQEEVFPSREPEVFMEEGSDDDADYVTLSNLPTPTDDDDDNFTFDGVIQGALNVLS